jgi:hypothetical protein
MGSTPANGDSAEQQNPFFLTKGGESCDEACQSVDDECDEGKITEAATDKETCSETLKGLGAHHTIKDWGNPGLHGCTWDSGQKGWSWNFHPQEKREAGDFNVKVQCSAKRDNGDEHSRSHRVCACKGGKKGV